MPTTQQSPVDGSPASTTQQPRTKDASVYTTQQSPTEYDGPALGRDDPVWLHYLGESTQRDMDLVDGWNKGMDVLLLFAALFSAVVTAFLVESYKKLQPDTALITAASVSRMVDLVEAIASREQAPPSASLPTLDNFQPSRSDVMINTLWFFSLALSMSVALIAMLVKQWGDGYRRGDRFSPHYVQARTRQARYNGLKNWGMKLVVRMLPIIMHVALWLFLLGLLILLRSLNHRLMQPVMVAVAITLGLYVFTTLVPLFSAFCPYNTPLSSRTVWGFFYSIVNLIIPSGEKWNTLPCERRERTQSTSTTLDELTAQAVVWLVSHSQAEKPVNAAIRAVANAIAGPEFWDHLVKDKIITLVAQRFTSFFKGTLDPPESDSKDNSVDEIINSEDLKRQVCSCTRALAKVAKHSTMQLVQDTGPNSTTPERAVKESGRIMLPEAYFISIQNGLYRLTESAYVDIAASGFCGASAWCTSTGRMNRNALEQQPLLRTLVSFLDKKSSQIPNKLLVDVVEALAVETSYMIWELPENEINKTLKLVVELCLPGPPGEPNLLDGPARRAVCVELAVVAALINDYQRIPDAEIDQLSKEGHDKIYGHYTKAHEIYELRYPYPAGSYLTYSRQWRAVWIAELCSKNPKYLEAHSDALLFLGLAGILRSFPMDSKLFIRVIELFIAQLKLESTRVNQSNRMSLPFVLVSSRDIQHQVAQDIFTAFHDPPSESNNESNLPSRSNGAIEAAKIKLLQCLVEHGQWIEFRPVFLVEILKMLKSSRNKEFRRQCIIALDNYWFMNSASGFDVYNPPDWELLIDFNLIHVLVEAFEAIKDEPNETTRLHSSIISCFSKIARTIRVQPSSGLPTTTTKGGSDAQTGSDQAVPQEATGQPELQAVTSQPQGNSAQVTNGQPNQEILEALKWLLRRDKKLFETFLIHIACADSLSQADLDFWRRAICGLFGEPKASPTTQTSATNGNPQAHPDPIPQVPPMGTSPQASTTNLHTRTPDSRTAAANPGPSISTTSASSQPTPTIDSQNSTTGTDRQPPPGSVHNTMASTSQPPATSFSAQVPTAGSDSRTFSSTAANSNAQASTSSGPQAPTSSSPPASASNSATALQPPPMTDDEAREWLRTFANNNVNEEGDLGRMAKDLRDALDKTDGVNP